MAKRPCWLSFLLLAFFGGAKFVFAFSGSGDGSPGSPYQITTCTQLQEVGSALSASYVLANDIDCSSMATGAGFDPIGSELEEFTGTFDGQGHTINALTITRPDEDNVGLFATANGASIQNVRITNATVTGHGAVGILGGIATSNSAPLEVDRCSVSGVVSGLSQVGGMFGGAVGSFSRLSSNVAVRALGTGNGRFGGIFGWASGPVQNSRATGSVEAASNDLVGGIAGFLLSPSESTLSSNYSTSSVVGENSVGGLVGAFTQGGSDNLTINYCIASGRITAVGRVAAIVGGNLRIVNPQIAGTHMHFSAQVTGQEDCSATGPTYECYDSVEQDFFNTSLDPLLSWDFESVWQPCSGGYPTNDGRCSGDIVNAQITPSSNISYHVGGSVSVSFKAVNIIDSDGKIIITFPDGFGFDSGGATVVQNLVNISGSLSLSRLGQKITLIRSGGTAIPAYTSISFELTGVSNPSSGNSGLFGIQVTNASDRLIDENLAVSGPTLACASGYFGLGCTSECPGGASNPCNSNGTCDEGELGSGLCSCSAGFSGTACDACGEGRFGNACELCPGGGSCSGHGTCEAGISGSGSCTCEAGFTGSDCGTQVSLAQPVVGSKKLKKAMRLSCLVNGVTPNSYTFYVKGKKGAAPKTERAYLSAQKTRDFKLKRLAKFEVRCAYTAFGRTSERSVKKTAQMP